MIIFSFSSVIHILCSTSDPNVLEMQWITIHKRKNRTTLIFFFFFFPFFLPLLNKRSFIRSFLFSLSFFSQPHRRCMRCQYVSVTSPVGSDVMDPHAQDAHIRMILLYIYDTYAHTIKTITCLPVDFAFSRSLISFFLSFLHTHSPRHHHQQQSQWLSKCMYVSSRKYRIHHLFFLLIYIERRN
jgi:hypothetical protein